MNKNIFIEDVRMDTQTAFLANGNINIYPCSWEVEKTPITPDGRASYKGRITVEEDGRTRVSPYNIGSQGPRYIELFATEHCRVMMTQRGQIIEKWSFRPSLTSDDIRALRAESTPTMPAANWRQDGETMENGKWIMENEDAAKINCQLSIFQFSILNFQFSI